MVLNLVSSTLPDFEELVDDRTWCPEGRELRMHISVWHCGTAGAAVACVVVKAVASGAPQRCHLSRSGQAVINCWKCIIVEVHIISVRPSKQPLMVRTFLKVYMDLCSYFLFLQEQIKNIIIIKEKTSGNMAVVSLRVIANRSQLQKAKKQQVCKREHLEASTTAQLFTSLPIVRCTAAN